MSSTTNVEPAALEAAAKKLDDLFADTSAFENLEKFELQAGPDTFDSANWLEALVDDRLKGLMAHGDAMKETCTDLAEKLRKIAKKFTDADSANAEALQTGALEIIDTWVGDTVDISFDDAEKTDVNFKGQDTKDVPRDDHFAIDKGNAVYDSNGQVKINMPGARIWTTTARTRLDLHRGEQEGRRGLQVRRRLPLRREGRPGEQGRRQELHGQVHDRYPERLPVLRRLREIEEPRRG